tara:strand:+ start:1511 stop:1828 length:318 start_codon:yes stop_codon:yes gene_type:complete
MTKTVWTPTEKESLKEKYGCEILVERANLEQLESTNFPTDSYIVKYKIEEETFHDLTRGTKVKLFDMYYDKFGKGIESINYGKGNIKPALWMYQNPQAPKKKKRR